MEEKEEKLKKYKKILKILIAINVTAIILPFVIFLFIHDTVGGQLNIL